MSLRLLELYVSTQGEGPRVGTPTVFVRFAGCNLRCPGWPCDTPYAIFPDQFTKEQEKIEPTALAERIMGFGIANVCLTGGEPFLQKSEDLEELVKILMLNGYSVECFSNGTRPYPDWAVRNLQFTMDWKLPGSGESHSNITRIENLARMSAYPRMRYQAVKFVVKDLDDFVIARNLWETYLKHSKQFETFAGRVWSDDPNALTDAQLVDWIISNKLPWRLNVQVHNHIWNREQRGI